MVAELLQSSDINPASGNGSSGLFYLKNYGCQMNVYDSQVMKRMLIGIGFTETQDLRCADLVILNTCHIRHKASEKIYSELGAIDALQRKIGKKIIVVAGCVSQAEGDGLRARAPYVDIILGPQSLHRLPEMVVKVARDHTKEIVVDFDPEEKFDYLREECIKTGDVSAFVSVQEGCDKFCTFCVVPYTRGSEFSRPVKDVFNEVNRLVESGVKEITLIGQNVNAYHGDYCGKEFSLGRLIDYISQVEGLCRIRYTTSHPRDMHEELYFSHSDNEKLMPFLNLPVQSGSDKVLRRMNRKHNRDEYLQIISRLKQARPDMAFSSDFIVGFAGESDEDFEQTLSLIKEAGFVHGYGFKYSIRPGTPGAEYGDQVCEEQKAYRLSLLQSLLQKQQLDHNCSFEGRDVPVLFDRKEEGISVGRTPYMQVVRVEGAEHYGSLRNVRITNGHQNSLKGVVIADYV